MTLYTKSSTTQMLSRYRLTWSKRRIEKREMKHTREFPRSGSKAKDGEKNRKKKKERPKVGNNNGQLSIANATSGGARKPPGPKGQ